MGATIILVAVVSWLVSLALFSALWIGLMRLLGAPITWMGFLGVASIVALAFAIQERVWWVAIPASVGLLISLFHFRRHSGEPER
jgi:hypothetical protein